MDVLGRADLPFPHSLPEFQRLFPDDAACAAYLEKARWGDGFACPHCGSRSTLKTALASLPPTGLRIGATLRWRFWAYLVAKGRGFSGNLVFRANALHAGMVRPNQDRIGGQPKNHVEVDETWVGGRTRGEGRGVHHKVLVSCAIEVRHRKPGTKLTTGKTDAMPDAFIAVVLDRPSRRGFRGRDRVTGDWLQSSVVMSQYRIGIPGDLLVPSVCGRFCSNLCRALGEWRHPTCSGHGR